MTIICSYCKMRIDELCPHCGMPAHRVNFRPEFSIHCLRRALLILTLRLVYGGILREPYICASMRCRQIFFAPGLGGVDTAVCDDCHAKVYANFSAADANKAADLGVN